MMAAMLILVASNAFAGEPEAVYRQAMITAATGHVGEARAMLAGAMPLLPESNVWRERMRVAEALLAMRQTMASAPELENGGISGQLIDNYLKQHLLPTAGHPWIPAMIGTLMPGAGHLWLGRYRDAAAAAVLVWPMLLLTLWAWRRQMGPVTVFFGIITAWLWSGSVFSAWSLAGRADMEAYLVWWQGLWQASGLPGRPW